MNRIVGTVRLGGPAAVGTAALLALAPAVASAGGLVEALAYLLPMLLLLGVLALRRYPGERVLHALADRRARRRRHRDEGSTGATLGVGRWRAEVARGGRLIACSLAVRPPPAALAASC